MTSAALAGRFRAVHVDDNSSDLNQVIARAEQSISDAAGPHVSVLFALSPNALRVGLPFSDLERVVCGLCAAARSLLGTGGRIVIETRGINDAPLTEAVSSVEVLPRVIVRAERGASVSPVASQRASGLQSTLTFADLEAVLARSGARLELVPLSDQVQAYVAHLPHAVGAESSARMAVAVPQEAGIILLVEDEPQVQAVTTRILRAFGYSVVTAHNERTALAQAEQYGAAIGLVVSDLVLPGVSGKDLVCRLRGPCERAEVLFISGYSPEHVGALTDGARFLRKPFSAQELLCVVRELLPEAAAR